MIWHNPEAFLLLIPLIGLGLRQWWQRKNRAALRFSTMQLVPRQKTWRVYLAPVPTAIEYLALFFLVIALARPQKSDELTKKNVEGIDIVITLDISDSMLIEDMPPLNRLEAAKETIRDFVKGRSSDRIGLTLFMGEAFTKIPLTLDYEMIVSELKGIQPSRTIKMGTAIGVALANAVARLKDSKAKSRIIVFLTDGENNSGTIDPETALEIAKGEGLKIYSIGIGKDGETRLPVYSMDPFGRKIKTYQPFHSTVNEELLQKMADDTGGKYWRATSYNGMKEIFREIDRLEKTTIEVNKYTRFTELYQKWLKLALFLLILSVAIKGFVLRRFP
jgi:Ca-activated chloride channel family protein